MSMQIANYPDPTRAAPTNAAYAWISGITIDAAGGAAWLTVPVWASADDYSAGAIPIDTVNVRFGSDGVPDFATFLANNASAWQAIGSAFYGAIASHPKFAGATQVP